MLQRLTLRGILVLLLVLTGGAILPTVSARSAHPVSVTHQRSERGSTAEILPADDLPASGAHADDVVAGCARTVTPPSRLAEHALFQRPPPALLA